MESKGVIRLLSIIHTRIILDLVCGVFSLSVRSLLSSFLPTWEKSFTDIHSVNIT